MLGSAASKGGKSRKSVVPPDAAGRPVPESRAGAGTESVPLRKAHVAHKWGQKDLDGAIPGHPNYAMAYRCCAANITMTGTGNHRNSKEP